MAYLHNKKIISKHKKFIDKGGEFFILYPTCKLINSKSIKKFEKIKVGFIGVDLLQICHIPNIYNKKMK